MLNSLYVAALGMHVQKSQLDVVSNNLANTNTPGYKKERADFSVLLDHQAAYAAAHSTQASKAPPEINRRDLAQGVLQSTGSPLDIAINGAGFLEIELGDERLGYIRGGSLKINSDGYLTTADGRLLKSDIRIPSNVSQLSIDSRGIISAKLGTDTKPTELGQLQLVSFSNSESLNYLGGGIFEATADQQVAVKAAPEQEGLGSLESNKLEMSNVNIVDEMVSMMMAQRVYELNSRVAQAADELMAMTNSLRRG